MPKIQIDQWPEPIEAGKKRVLEAALDAGVPFPHGCNSGECGSCRCELTSGEIRSDSYSPHALSEADRERGFFLACRARPVGDIKLRWLSQAVAMPVVKANARVTKIERASDDVIVVRMALPEGMSFNFHPGQFAKLRFGKSPVRSYSMASQPGAPELVFHIRVVPDGQASGHVDKALKVGDFVEVQGPFGDAYWDGRKDAPLLLLAGGTGLAPMMSVLDAAIRDGQAAEHIHLYHGVRSGRDLYALEHLQDWADEHGFRFVPVLLEGEGHRKGHLHEALAEDFPDLSSAHIYTAGPPPMVEAIQALAVARGASGDRVRADAFFASEPESKGLWGRLSKVFGSSR
jgi:CDP-4-dehydro-6-deoxyglucose reductase/ferredoxin-NAD(P)+ reductase (naphthalene dioxygenase ferredoxin-specific)